MLIFFAGAGEMYGLSIGDHATSENIVPCWNCQQCLQGRYHLCEGERSHPHVVFNSAVKLFQVLPIMCMAGIRYVTVSIERKRIIIVCLF